MFDPHQHHRHSIRLPHYDYREAGAYFVTICAAAERPVFGKIDKCETRLHPYDKIVQEEWIRMTGLRANVESDAFVVMPNHFHAIVLITKSANPTNPVGAQLAAPLRLRQRPANNVASGSLGAIVRGFKSAVTRRINIERAAKKLPPVVVWQRLFFERVIRDETELLETRRYIIENPIH